MIMEKLKKNNLINNNFKYRICDIDNIWENVLNSVNIFLPFNRKNIILKILNSLKSNNDGIVIKFNKNYDNIIDDYNIGKKLEKIQGFIKYICYIETNHDILSLLYDNYTNCYKKYYIILMPYYYKNMGNYKWEESIDLINCLKQAVLSFYKAYFEENILISDFNVHNILLDEKLRKKTIKYMVYDNIYYIVDSFIDIKIVDFDNSRVIFNKYSDINYIYFYNSLINLYINYKNNHNVICVIEYIESIKYKNPIIVLDNILKLTNKIIII